jgi:two-component system chemotaxis sensor kinase CheA
VEEIVLLGAGSRRHIERNHEGEVLRWRGRLLPVIRLCEVLARREPFDDAALAEVAERYHREDASGSGRYAAIVRLGSRRFVMVFDEVLGVRISWSSRCIRSCGPWGSTPRRQSWATGEWR